MAKNMINLSIIIAAYNEEPVIADNINKIIKELKSRPNIIWEIICVDDGSTDKTGELMDKISTSNSNIKVYHHRRNFGQGRALRTAFDCCQGEVIVTLDADLSYGPEYIFRLYDAILREKVEIALASPYSKGGAVRNVPFYRHFLSRLGNRYLAKMSHYPISTSTCVVRAYHREVLDTLVLTSDGMEFQLEVLMKASLMGFRVCEIPAQLEWANEKVSEADFRRISKMRIFRTIKLYLLMGWLSKPASLFIIFSFLLLIPGIYMAFILFYRLMTLVILHSSEGFIKAISIGMGKLFAEYTYSVVFSSAFFLIGINIFFFALISLQNKFYFEEIYRLGLQHKNKIMD